MVNVPVSDTFAVRVAAKTIQQDEGYWFNRVIGDDIGKRDFFGPAARKPPGRRTTRSDSNLKFEGQRSRSEMGAGRVLRRFEVPPHAAAGSAHAVPRHRARRDATDLLRLPSTSTAIRSPATGRATISTTSTNGARRCAPTPMSATPR